MKLKDLYLKCLNKKEEGREWEPKWTAILQINDISWGNVWTNLNDNTHKHYVKSTIWEINHFNFWSGFKAGERCKLCNEFEEDTSHIINKCIIILQILRTFQIYDKYDNQIKISFGVGDYHLSNLILFHIKYVIFRS